MSLLFAQVVGTQYYDTGWMQVGFALLLATFVLVNIFRAKGGRKDMYIRRIAGLNAIDEAIGRSTEMGKPVLMVPGLGALNAISVQALNIFAYVTKTAARFANPIRLCCGDPAVYTVAQEIIRDVYQNEGMPERYDPDSVRFLSDRQFAFAASVSGTILREQTSACFFMGEFFAESLIFAETANSIGAIQVASSTQITQTPFFIAACDYVLIGEEFYAASAYLTREPVLVGSLIGQDWSKLAVIALTLMGVASASIERGSMTSTMRDENGRWVKLNANQATTLLVGGNWVSVKSLYATVTEDMKTGQSTTAEDGSITYTFAPQKTVDADGVQVEVSSITVGKGENRAALGKYAQVDGKWTPVKISESEDFDENTAMPVKSYKLEYDGKAVPIEESKRQRKRGETWMGTLGSPGDPPPIEIPRQKEQPAEGEKPKEEGK